ncbi:hypothetical protein E2P86_08560 [Sphingobacterium psychroaquaticum]|uniref:hypothetical protein n=1 Tax=Sphingobacterium psychroaquaticum TaxID=561061 RepID=UPI00106D5A62|nr:hypothetical protein [Sphingobacterium psychroaquaticum]QBQ41205.1 hypothetical protein E2P86_08560 [Sphingobacterium psychroaquaticum]
MLDKTLKTAVGAMGDIKSVLELADVVTNTSMTGEIRLLSQKLNSEKEDIIVNTIVSNAEQVTEGVFNINIHVPNFKNQSTGVPNAVDNTQPNIARMEEIGSYVMKVVDGFRGFDFIIHLDSGGEVIPNGNKWYYNIVVRYFYLRKDKK